MSESAAAGTSHEEPLVAGLALARAADALRRLPGDRGLDAALAELAGAGVPARLHLGESDPAGAIALRCDGRTLGALELLGDEPVAEDTAAVLASLFTLALAARSASAPRAGDSPLPAQAFEALPVAIAVAEAGTDRILAANAAFLDLVDLPAAHVVGALPPYAWSEDPGEDLVRRADGSVVPVETLHVAVPPGGGAPACSVTVLTDATDLRRFEQQLTRVGKLAALGELTPGLAHELNNPLFAILGLVEFLLKEVEPDSKAHKRLLLIESTGLEMKHIVRAVHGFARASADEVGPVDLAAAAAATVELVRRASSAKGVELVEALEADGITVSASPNQLMQVFLNLLTNAQQAMPDGGSVTVGVRREGSWAVATVADTGPGIAPDVLPQVFDPFFTTKRGHEGGGLGLTASRAIARAHGGDLTVSSTAGAGAAFTLRLPLAGTDAP